MTNSIKPQPGILDITPYKGGAGGGGAANVIKLSSNENPHGPSEKAKTAYANAAQTLHRYPSTDHLELRQAIAKAHELDVDRIFCGAGSDEIIAFLCQAYAGPGDEVIHTEHGFSMYRISALAAGATPVEAPETDRCVDVDAILEACTTNTRLVFIANPANPTGTMIGAGEVSRMADALPDHVLLVLDGAYAEYVDGFDGAAALVDQRQNVVMTRTFSKLYGLGGLRIGWGYGPTHVVDALNRVRGPFNLSQAQLLSAEAAVKDQDYAQWCRRENTRLRSWLANALAKAGVASDVSFANFILARFSDATEANACDKFLQGNGLIVRTVAGYKLPNCLRITIGDEASCHAIASAVTKFKEDRK